MDRGINVTLPREHCLGSEQITLSLRGDFYMGKPVSHDRKVWHMGKYSYSCWMINPSRIGRACRGLLGEILGVLMPGISIWREIGVPGKLRTTGWGALKPQSLCRFCTDSLGDSILFFIPSAPWACCQGPKAVSAWYVFASSTQENPTLPYQAVVRWGKMLYERLKADTSLLAFLLYLS